METLEIYHCPVDHDDLHALGESLYEADVLIPSFDPGTEDIYAPLTYWRVNTWHQTETILLVDRNVLTRWVSILRGERIEPSHRLAAAIMAFAQCAGMLIEPGMSEYELADLMGNMPANDELRLFRIGDNIHPQQWTDIALGRSDTIVYDDIAPPEIANAPVIDFTKSWSRWRCQYTIALKIAELELNSGQPETCMVELLRWLYEDFLFSAPAIMLASHYFAPNSARKGLFKNLRSRNRDDALAGIRNAAWDLTLVSEWLRRVGTQIELNQLTLLCSLDRKLMRIARELSAPFDSTVSPTDETAARFIDVWGPTIGARLARVYHEYATSIDNPQRRVNQPAGLAPVANALLVEGEAKIRAWIP